MGIDKIFIDDILLLIPNTVELCKLNDVNFCSIIYK